MKTTDQTLREQLQERVEKRSKPSVFEVLSAIDVTAYIDVKRVPTKSGKELKLSYLKWAWAWGAVVSRYPDASYKVYEREDGRIYWDDGRTAWVKVSVTIEGTERIEYYPIIDNRNQSIPIEKITSMDANTAIQRGITKAIGRHGCGISLWISGSGEAPEFGADDDDEQTAQTPQTAQHSQTTTLTPEHSKQYRSEMNKFQQEYEQTMGEPLYKAVLREMGTKDFKSIPDSRFNDLMGVIETCRLMVQE